MENRNDNNYDEPLNMNPNKSELPNQKNSTIKKIQFYVTMVIGIIFLLLVLFSFFKNILSSEKEEKVVEVEAPKVQKLEKDNLFANVKDNEKETSPFVVEEKSNIFEATQIEKPPKPQIPIIPILFLSTFFCNPKKSIAELKSSVLISGDATFLGSPPLSPV